MRNLVDDEVAIRSAGACNEHVWIIDPYLEAFRMEFFDDPKHWTFSQIVCSGLEAEAKYSDVRVARRLNLLKRSLDLPLIRVQNRVEHGDIHVHASREVIQRANVFWETRASEREAGA